jgi:hypothetical protein
MIHVVVWSGHCFEGALMKYFVTTLFPRQENVRSTQASSSIEEAKTLLDVRNTFDLFHNLEIICSIS